jgi:hypothetical protein
MEADLQAVRDLVNAARLSESVRQTAVWCLDQLLSLYREFLQTCNQRQGDEIRRLVQGMIQGLAEEALARPVAEAIVDRLRAMHERLGMPALEFNFPKQPRKRQLNPPTGKGRPLKDRRPIFQTDGSGDILIPGMAKKGKD